MMDAFSVPIDDVENKEAKINEQHEKRVLRPRQTTRGKWM